MIDPASTATNDLDGVSLGEPDEIGFRSLHDLRVEGISIADLATAIEADGGFGWDRFGRLVPWGKTHVESAKALDALARAVSGPAHREGDAEPDGDAADNPWYEFGWPEANLPSFESPAPGHSKSPRPSAVAKRNNSMAHFAGALLVIVRGDLDGRAHPDCKTDAALIEKIQVLFPGVSGLSKRNLQALIPELRSLMKG